MSRYPGWVVLVVIPTLIVGTWVMMFAIAWVLYALGSVLF